MNAARGVDVLLRHRDVGDGVVTLLGERVLVRTERVVGDIDAENLVLLGELDPAVPLDAVRRGDGLLEARAIDVGEHVEHRELASRALLLLARRGVDDVLGIVLVHEVHHLHARVPGEVEGSGLDESLDHAAVSLGAVDPVDEVVEVLEGTVLVSLRHDGVAHALAHAADACEPEPDALGRRREVLAGLVDVRWEDGDALVTAGGDVVHDLVRLAHVGGEDGGHVLAREVGLEPGGLHDEDGVAGRVALVEGIRGELEDVVPDALRDLLLVAVLHRAVHPVVVGRLVLAVVPVEGGAREELDLLLGDGLADARVGLAGGEVGHLDGDLHDLFLVHDGAIGLVEDVGEAVVVEDDRLLAVHAVDVGRDHAGAERSGSVEGDECDDLLVLLGLHALDGGRHAAGLDLEHARRMALAHEGVDVRIGEVNLVNVDVDAGGPVLDAGAHRWRHLLDVGEAGMAVADVGERLGDDRQGAQAEEVHLEQAHVRDRVALVLRDGDVALGVELRGDVVGDRRGRDERGAGVDALAAGEALDRERGVDDLPGLLVGLVGLLEVGRVLVLLALVLVERVGKREARVVGEHLGELLPLVDGEAQHAVGVVDGLLRLDGGVGDDLAHVVLAVDLAHVLKDVLEVLVVEVHVDIGHLGALGREEPLEHEAVLERVEARDVHGVGDDGACG